MFLGDEKQMNMLRSVSLLAFAGLLFSASAYSDDMVFKDKKKYCGGFCLFSKKFTAYPTSLFSMAHNKYCTNTLLTSTKAINNVISDLKSSNKESKIFGFKNAHVKYFWSFSNEHLETIKQKMADSEKTKEPFAYMVHTMVKPGYVRHSTLMVIGRNKNGLYGMYLDPQGHRPMEATMEDPSLTDTQLKTAQDVYDNILGDKTNEVPLMYSGERLQADFVSCTAYTALFIKTLVERIEAETLNNFSPDKLMQEFADDNLVSFSEVRSMVCLL